MLKRNREEDRFGVDIEELQSDRKVIVFGSYPQMGMLLELTMSPEASHTAFPHLAHL